MNWNIELCIFNVPLNPSQNIHIFGAACVLTLLQIEANISQGHGTEWVKVATGRTVGDESVWNANKQGINECRNAGGGAVAQDWRDELADQAESSREETEGEESRLGDPQ